MRWTDRYIDSLDREGQIAALKYAQNCVCNLERHFMREMETDKQIEALKAKAEEMKKGLSVKKIAGISAAVVLVGSFAVGLNRMLSILVVLLIAYFVFDRIKLAPVRCQKAEVYFNENYVPLASSKRALKEEYDALSNSEEAYNTMMLLPKEYMSSQKIQMLIELLRERRARTITEAMTVCENNAHHRKMESMSQEQLRVAKETAEAQKRAAIAAENTEKHTREIAKEQQKMAQEQMRQAEETQRIQATLESQQEQKGKTMRCFNCAQEISVKAKSCPFCHSTQYRGPLETLLGIHNRDLPYS